MRLTGLYVAIVMASLHASGFAVSTSNDADAALSENKATSMSVSSPRANGKRSLRAEKQILDGLDEDRTLPGPFAESTLGLFITRATEEQFAKLAKDLVHYSQRLEVFGEDVEVGKKLLAFQDNLAVYVRGGLLTAEEASDWWKTMLLVWREVGLSPHEAKVWMRGVKLLNKNGVITREQLKHAEDRAFGRKIAWSGIGKKKLKWTQLEELKKRQAKL
ncbi:unnamed protein product [Hyaloperonospora brassicae]|uniref:RxLR effector protein n=1 Tax=Hyaloperonospora brassicae TaxID=162125 RepID=A0AAV0TST7_HYABA|nr:unnamed protein product [Hyaloperonospora brassicae]